MRGRPDFIQRLSLAPDADERQVRRAYARELKLIDQQTDLEGFQHLRACYEAALAWAERRAAGAVIDEDQYQYQYQDQDQHQDQHEDQREPAQATALADPDAGAAVPETPHPRPSFAPRNLPVAVPDLAPPRPQLPSPHALAGAVFADFHARFPILAATPDHAAQDDAQRTAPWTRALDEALADPRLLNLDARLVFEGRVAALLAQGWQPGHHLLLVAANAVFKWSADRHALARLGYPGTVLDAALEQREMFHDQPQVDRGEQRKLLGMLRAGRAPDGRTLNQYTGALRQLERHFPALLTVVAPGAAVARWRELGAAIPDAAPVQPATVKAAPKSRSLSLWFFVMFALWTLSKLMSGPIEHVGNAPREWNGGSGRPPLVRENDRVLKERIEQIRARIDYKPARGTLPGQQLADVHVRLGPDRKVVEMRAEVTGADPAFIAAVERAIEASGPFPVGSPSSFMLEYEVTVHRPDSLQAAPTRQAPRGDPVPKERMASIRLHMDYRPGDDVPPGEQKVAVEVRLDDKGNVESIKRLVTPKDPALAVAFERAIRATGPFSAQTARVFSLEYHVRIPPRQAGAGA